MLVKLDLININILSRALYREGTVCKRLVCRRKQRKARATGAQRSAAKISRRKQCIMQGFLSQRGEFEFFKREMRNL